MVLFPCLKRDTDAEKHAHNLGMARSAVDQCDAIAETGRGQQRKAAALRTLAEIALKGRNRALALQLLREKAGCEAELARTSRSLQVALANLRTLIAVLEFEAAMLPIRRRRGVTAFQQGRHVAQQIEELAAREPGRLPSDRTSHYTIGEAERVSHYAARQFKKIAQKWLGTQKIASDTEPPSSEEIAGQMARRHAKNLEMGLQAVTQAANLMQMVQDQQKKVATLTAKAQLSRDKGDADLADQLLRERGSYEDALAMTVSHFQQALETLDAILFTLEKIDPILCPSENKKQRTVPVSPVKSEASEPVEKIPSPKRKKRGKNSGKRYR